MEVSDDMVIRLRSELENALARTPPNIMTGQLISCIDPESSDFVQLQKLGTAFLLASGVFRGAAVALRGKM
jgi:hypothetical protein